MYLIRHAKGDPRKPYYPSCRRFTGWTRASYLGCPRLAEDRFGTELRGLGRALLLGETANAAEHAYGAYVIPLAQAFPLTACGAVAHLLKVRFAFGATMHLAACSCLVQNGCTTAVEGFILGTRIVCYVPEEDPRYEFQLPNELGTRCHDAAAVIDAIWNPPEDRDPGGERLVARHIHGLLPRRSPHATLARLPLHLAGRVSATLRARKKRVSERAGSARYSEGFKRQRFPLLDAAALQAPAECLRGITGAGRPIIVSRRAEDIFEVRAR